MSTLFVKRTDGHRITEGDKWVDVSTVIYGEVVGYVQDFYNRPCAVVLEDRTLVPVQLDELTVMNEGDWNREQQES